MKRYFAWKDAGCNGIDPEWIEISGEEFALLKKENPQRRFIPSYNEDDPQKKKKDTYDRKSINGVISADLAKWFTQDLDIYYTQ